MHCNRHVLLALVLGACVISRLPLVYFPAMPLTGDECVVALMGKHLAEGTRVSLYFYGQHYGLSIIEAAAAAAAYPVFGVTAVAVKMGMLGLLLVAAALLFRALARITGRGGAAALGVLLLLAIPPWTLWSIQARGGYITAMAATAAVLVGIARLEDGSSGRDWIGVSVAATIAILAKASWLPALIPILLLIPVQRRDIRLGVILLAGIGILSAAVHFTGTRLTGNYWQQPGIDIAQIGTHLRLLPSLLHYHFTTDLFSAGTENRFYQLCGWTWLLGLPVGLGIQGWRVATRRYCPWSHALCLSTLGNLAALLVIPLLPRYLLSISFFLVLWLVVDMAALPQRRLSVAVALVLISLGFAGLGRDRYTTTDTIGEGSIRELVGLLEDEGIHHIYTTEALLQWMVMFYSNESIRCRWVEAEDRLPDIPHAIDQALFSGKPTAIIGILSQLGGLGEPDAGIDVYSFPGLPFFIAPNPTPEVLKAHGFELNRPRLPAP